MPIPRSRRGGWRRRDNSRDGWEYWYPSEGDADEAGDDEAPKKPDNEDEEPPLPKAPKKPAGEPPVPEPKPGDGEDDKEKPKKPPKKITVRKSVGSELAFAVEEVRKAKVDKRLDVVWRLQAYGAKEMFKAYSRAVSRPLTRLSRGISSVEQVKAAMKAADAAANDFANSDATDELLTEIVRKSHAVGRLYMRERDANIRRKAKKLPGATLRPPDPSGALADVEIEKAGPGEEVVATFDFEAVDEEAIARIIGIHHIWFRDASGLGYDDERARQEVLDFAKQQLESGVSGVELAPAIIERLEAIYGVGTFADKGLSYWGGVIENASTTAGVQASLIEMRSAGWVRFEIVNPMDERTTPICQIMNGTILFIEDALDLFSRLGEAESIDDVKKIKPFAPGGSAKPVKSVLGSSFKVGITELSIAQSNRLSEAGFAFPPYHFRCRSWVDIAWEPGQPLP